MSQDTPARADRYHRTAVPHLMVDGAAEALDFYARAFGAVELFRLGPAPGRIIHAEMSLQGSVFMVGDADGDFSSPQSLGGTTFGVHVYVDDVDDLATRAVDAGAVEVQPPTDMFYGDRSVMLRDPFGHVWVFLQHLEDVSLEEIVRRAEAMFGA